MKFLQPSEYQTKAEEIFDLLKNKLLIILPEAEVEHVGSSSIHAAVSKGDLDILVRTTTEKFNYSLEQIQKLNFSIKSDTKRTDTLCMLITSDFDIDVAIQLIVKGSECENFVIFRDRLNDDPELVQKYNTLKISCTGMSPEEYRLVKSKFIRGILGLNE